MNHHRLAIITLLFAFLGITGFSNSATAQIFGAQVDPTLQWQTITTEHFRVHFHQGQEGLAHHVATISEEAYAIIEAEFGDAPRVLDVVLFDAFDFSNGSANPIFDVVTLIPSQYRLSDWGNIRLDSWWHMLIFHELVHAIELDMTQGFPDLIRKFFGKISVPNIIKPVPFIEGHAVYQKYKYTGESRHNDSRTQMFIRQMVLDNNIPEFQEIKQFYSSTEWPTPGFLVYNFGSWLMRYIEETHGEDAMRRFNEANAGNSFNLFLFSDLNETIEKTFEVTADELYEGFRSWLRDQFTDEINDIQAEPLTQPLQISTTSHNTAQPSWSPDGEWIAYVHNGPGRGGLRMIKPDGEGDHEIANGALIAHPSWSHDSKKIVYTKLDLNTTQYLLNDIYVYDLETEREERLTTRARSYYARFSLDDSEIYFAKTHGRDGSTALAKLNLESEEIEILKEFPDGSGIIHSFDISPADGQIAMALLKYGGFQDLYIFDESNGELMPITQNKDQVSDPVWSPDGQYILFSADSDRVYNIYAYQVATSTFHQVTNMMSGGFYPTFSANQDELALVSYEGTGYNVYKMPFAPDTFSSVSFSNEQIPEWEGYPPHTLEIKPYNPIAHLAPRGWLPFPTENGVGLFAFGLDPLLQHSYQGTVGWNFSTNTPEFSLGYVLQVGFPIQFQVNSSQIENSRSLQMIYPLFASAFKAQTLNLGYTQSTTFEKWHEDLEEYLPLESPVQTETISSTYTIAQIRQHDLFSSQMLVSVSGSTWKHGDTGNWLQKAVVSWSETFRIPTIKSHTLTLSVMAGWTDTDDEDEQFVVGGHNRQYPIRGLHPETYTGQQMLKTTVQQNFHLLDVHMGVGHWPLFIDDLGINIFLDAGLASNEIQLKDIGIAFGTELTISATMSYFLPLELQIGIAQGIGEDSPVIYLNAGAPGLF